MGQTDRETDISGPLLDRQTEGLMALPVHVWSIWSPYLGGHMRHHIYSLPKKLTFAKFAHERTNGRTDKQTDGKKKTSKVPFRINARELKR